MTYTTIKYETKEGVASMTLCRPGAGNSVNLQMAAELRDICSLLNQQEDIRAVIITGAGDTDFCCGEDAVEFSTLPAEELSRACSSAEAVSKVELPVIAAINGHVSGIGLAIALACDLRIASDHVYFSGVDNGHGPPLPTGLTQWLPRIIGIGKATELLLLNESIDSPAAYQAGLVHKLVPHSEVTAAARKLASSIASKAPIALKYAKEAVNKGLDLTLEQGLRLECDLYMILHTTHDRHEGIKAFQQKRPPKFEGK